MDKDSIGFKLPKRLHAQFKKHVKKEGSNITEHLTRLIKMDMKINIKKK